MAWQHCADLTAPEIKPQISCIDSLLAKKGDSKGGKDKKETGDKAAPKKEEKAAPKKKPKKDQAPKKNQLRRNLIKNLRSPTKKQKRNQTKPPIRKLEETKNLVGIKRLQLRKQSANNLP